MTRSGRFLNKKNTPHTKYKGFGYGFLPAKSAFCTEGVAGKDFGIGKLNLRRTAFAKNQCTVADYHPANDRKGKDSKRNHNGWLPGAGFGQKIQGKEHGGPP